MAEFNDPNYLRGIEQFSHLWLLFRFHQTADKGHSPLVRPPRLGGNKKLGVFATRSTFRPNAIGMSVVEFVGVEAANKSKKIPLILKVRGMDLLDQTPVLDIKPYIPYADSVPKANGGFAPDAPQTMPCEFAPSVLQDLQQYQHQYPQLKELIRQVLSQDPRPAYQTQPDAEYAMTLYCFNIRWRVRQNSNHVFAIEKLNQ